MLAVIGGTGLNRLENLEVVSEHRVGTPFGEPSHPVLEGRLGGASCLFLARHGAPHHIAPHRINYRANIWALKELGARDVLGVNAVGGIHESAQTGCLLVPDQLVDYTWGRAHSFCDGEAGELAHIDFTEPYCVGLRGRLLGALTETEIPHERSGTYAVTQGPRLETAAEIQRLARDGCHVVGMTGMPEAVLAAELGLAYASLCIVVNPAAGLSDEPITLESMQSVLEAGSLQVGRVLSALARSGSPGAG